MPGARCARSLACENNKAHELSHHRFTGITRHSLPCAMVLTVSFVLSSVTGLFCHRRSRKTSRDLDASVWASGPHDFAYAHPPSLKLRRTRPVEAFGVGGYSAARLASLPRPPHPVPNVRDDRDTPLLVRTGRAGCCR